MPSEKALSLLSRVGKTLATNDGAVVIYRDKKHTRVNGFETFKANLLRNPLLVVAIVISAMGLGTAVFITILVLDKFDEIFPNLSDLGEVSIKETLTAIMLGPLGWLAVESTKKKYEPYGPPTGSGFNADGTPVDPPAYDPVGPRFND